MPKRSLPHLSAARLGLLAGLALAAASASSAVPTLYAQSPAVSLQPSSAGTPATAARQRPAPKATVVALKEEARPGWNELTPEQQQALAPLYGTWGSLTAAHKRKWLAMSQNYARMPAEERAKLHSRMTEWAALTPQQRAQARLNFAETKALSADDKKALWEAYQALPAEEKRRLAAGAKDVKPPPPPTAAAVRPVPSQKITKVPQQKASPRASGLAAAPSNLDQNTLLPQSGTGPARQN